MRPFVFVFDIDDTLCRTPSNFHRGWRAAHDAFVRTKSFAHIERFYQRGYPCKPNVARSVASLPGRKILFTNASRMHATQAVQASGLGGVFELMYDADLNRPLKPHADMYSMIESRVSPAHRDQPLPLIAFLDDQLPNLHTAYTRGWYTLWVHPDPSMVVPNGVIPPYVMTHYRSIEDALDGLHRVLGRDSTPRHWLHANGPN